jgi:opacity protein-like surface antigen
MPTSRSYSDPSFGSKKIVKTAYEGHAINGTNASATTLGSPLVANGRTTILDVRAFNTTIGTQAIANSIIVNTHSAGTGTAVAIGTLSLGTAGAVLAAGQTFAGSCTESTISAGDRVSLTLAAGTETAANPRIVVEVEYTEAFLVTEE